LNPARQVLGIKGRKEENEQHEAKAKGFSQWDLYLLHGMPH
jgi:hypothetical protein